MKTKKRLTKRELKRDPFVDTVFDWALWGRENLRFVALGLGVVALLGLTLLLYRGSRAAESRRATQKYQEIWQTYVSGNYQLAANDFRQFRDQYRKSAHGDDATLYLADAYYRSGDYPSAIEVLEGFEDEYGDSPLSYAAANLLGAAYESSGDWIKAAQAFAEAREGARYDFQKVAALMNEVRTYAGQGDAEKAAGAYRRISEEFPESPSAPEARVRLSELEATPIGDRAESRSSAARADSSPQQGTELPSGAPAPPAGAEVSLGAGSDEDPNAQPK